VGRALARLGAEYILAYSPAARGRSERVNRLAALGLHRHRPVQLKDLSSTVIPDDVIQRLVSFPNVIVTGHQAFFTREALGTILDTTLRSISDFAAGRPLANEIAASA
jgi:D-lactate dehydrogenase